jgi:DNA-binding IclR family transcriptional regulator
MENKFATPPRSPEEVLQRLAQLELRQMLIDKSTLKVGMVCVVFPVPSQRLIKYFDSSIS